MQKLSSREKLPFTQLDFLCEFRASFRNIIVIKFLVYKTKNLTENLYGKSTRVKELYLYTF